MGRSKLAYSVLLMLGVDGYLTAISQPNEAEHLSVSEFLKARDYGVPAPRLKTEERGDGTGRLLLDHADETAWLAAFCGAFGTLNSDFAGTQSDLLTNAVINGGRTISAGLPRGSSGNAHGPAVQSR